jgi:predicted phosphoribosyltransferase
MRWRDRREAGKQLAERLQPYAGTDAVVLGLPRGGLPVAEEVAARLKLPLDIVVARKIGAPGQEEFAIGAVSARGVRLLNESALSWLPVPEGYLEAETEKQRHVAAQRESYLRGAMPALPLAGRPAIVVDDGIATGLTALTAIAEVRDRQPARLVVAVPVAAPEAYSRLQTVADEVVALSVPVGFMAVGQFYDDFSPVSDAEARDCLLRARAWRQAG